MKSRKKRLIGPRSSGRGRGWGGGGGFCFGSVGEAKAPRNKRGTVQPSQFKPAQKEWRNKTACWPRITVVSAQDAVEQIRELTR